MTGIKIIGLLDVKRKQDQRVYERGGLVPLRAENNEVKILEKMNSIDKTRQDKTRQDKTRQDKTRQWLCVFARMSSGGTR